MDGVGLDNWDINRRNVMAQYSQYSQYQTTLTGQLRSGQENLTFQKSQPGAGVS